MSECKAPSEQRTKALDEERAAIYREQRDMKTAKRKTREPVRVMNLKESRGQERDWDWKVDQASSKAKVTGRDVDYRKGWYAKVEDQKDTGACVGFAVVDLIRFMLVQSGRLSWRKRLSFMWVWCNSKETDKHTSYPSALMESAGTFLKAALDIARKFGVIEEKFQRMGKTVKGSPQAILSKAAELKIVSYYGLSFWGREFGLEGVDYWMENHGPIVTRLNVDKGFLKPSRKRDFVLERYTGGMYGGHGVQVVAKRTRNGKKEYCVKNQWGRRWGYRGFLWVSEEYAKIAFTEAYGVKV